MAEFGANVVLSDSAKAMLCTIAASWGGLITNGETTDHRISELWAIGLIHRSAASLGWFAGGYDSLAQWSLTQKGAMLAEIIKQQEDR